MKRHRTQITVWPAITDLMTSIVVIGVLIGIIGYASLVGLEEKVRELEVKVDTLRNTIERQSIYIKALEDSIAEIQGKGLGSPSCLGLVRRGNPKPLMTIHALPDGVYSISIHRPMSYIEGDFGAVEEYVNAIPDGRIVASQMTAHAREIYQLIPELTPQKCIFYVRLENHDSVSKSSLRSRWTDDLERYFGLTNPSIRW